jgi:hypothetical protein
VRGTIQATDEVHRWRLASGAGPAAVIWMIELEGDYAVEVVTPDGTLVAAASSGGASDLALQFAGREGGDYLIAVTASDTSGSSYRLVVTIDAEDE